MARRDGKGPLGLGPMTGRGLGFCSGEYSEVPRFGRRSGYGRGIGQGYRQGFGRGNGRRYIYDNADVNNSYYKDENINESMLLEEKNRLEARLKEINDLME